MQQPPAWLKIKCVKNLTSYPVECSWFSKVVMMNERAYSLFLLKIYPEQSMFEEKLTSIPLIKALSVTSKREKSLWVLQVLFTYDFPAKCSL